MKALTPRSIKWLFSKEIQAVAAYMAGSKEVAFFLDIWAHKIWEAFLQKNWDSFIQMLSIDINVTIIHELIHKYADNFMKKNCGVSPEYPEAWEIWEETVEGVANQVVSEEYAFLRFAPCIEIEG